uniref:Uncharacterized protein n=1 Tax=Vespula pensylvanica TaxID=30213 RepID=A0A834U5B1_VESPE|nr:hypothetical protein H0235_011606 [Vespula pensylvanica]
MRNAIACTSAFIPKWNHLIPFSIAELDLKLYRCTNSSGMDCVLIVLAYQDKRITGLFHSSRDKNIKKLLSSPKEKGKCDARKTARRMELEFTLGGVKTKTIELPPLKEARNYCAAAAAAFADIEKRFNLTLDSWIGIDLSSTYIAGARKYIAFSRISLVIFRGEVLTEKSPSRVDPVEKSFHMHRMPGSLRVPALNRSNVKPAVRYNGRRYSPVLMGWTRLRTLKSYQRQHADESLKSVAYPKGPLAFREVFRNAALEAQNICLSGDFGQCRTVAARLEPSTETWTRVVTHVGRRCGVTSVDCGSGALVSLGKEHVEMYRDETGRERANCIALGNSTGS